MQIELKILNKEFYDSWPKTYKKWPLPEYATPGDCGMDLRATRDYVIAPQERVKIATGIAIHIGADVGGFILPRSGKGTDGLVLANTIGIIDGDYQGELIISAWNSLESFAVEDEDGDLVLEYLNEIKIKAGDRIAQLLFLPIIKPSFTIVDEFSEQTERNTNGFGSTDR